MSSHGDVPIKTSGLLERTRRGCRGTITEEEDIVGQPPKPLTKFPLAVLTS